MTELYSPYRNQTNSWKIESERMNSGNHAIAYFEYFHYFDEDVDEQND